MLMLMMTHQAKARLDHIEKHVAEARRLLGVLAGDARAMDKLEAAASLLFEFQIIKGDAECALVVLGNHGED